MSGIKRKIEQVFNSEDFDHVVYKEESLLDRLASSRSRPRKILGIPLSRHLLLVMISVAAIVGLTLTASFSAKLLKDGLLSGGAYSSNENGAIPGADFT